MNLSIFNYAWNMKKNGRAEATIESTTRRLKQLSTLCNINEPEEVKAIIANSQWKNSTKRTIITLYDGFAKFLGKQWEKPNYKAERTLPFIPTEQELDNLICAGRPKIATLLQTLKETGARIGEITDFLKWTDIDTQRKTITITAEKGSNSRILPISEKLIAMLNNLPKKNDKVFQTTKVGLRNTLTLLRKRTAKKLNNPRLNKISFHTFRHWKGTTEYHKTKDIIHVKSVLGHKHIDSTMIYINIESALYVATSDEWTCKATTNNTKATQLIENGFEYVLTTPDGLMLFRKRK